MADTPETTPRAPELIPIPNEVGWAHVWADIPGGGWQPIADYHLVCGRAKAFTQRMPDGTTRHVCRACAIDAALEAAGG